jgi:hypothetical protein
MMATEVAKNDSHPYDRGRFDIDSGRHRRLPRTAWSDEEARDPARPLRCNAWSSSSPPKPALGYTRLLRAR